MVTRSLQVERRTGKILPRILSGELPLFYPWIVECCYFVTRVEVSWPKGVWTAELLHVLSSFFAAHFTSDVCGAAACFNEPGGNRVWVYVSLQRAVLF